VNNSRVSIAQNAHSLLRHKTTVESSSMRNAFSSHILGTVQENQMRGKKVPVLGGSKIRGKSITSYLC